MRAVTATGTVNADHTLTVQVPADIPPGPLSVVVVLEETPAVPRHQGPLVFHPHDVGPVDPDCTFRREDIYEDDTR